MNKIEHKKKAMIDAMEKSLGIVTSACKLADVGRTTYYGWYNDDPEFRKAIDDIENIALDFAESKLHALIKEGNPTATIFYLKTKGKNRGYVERTEIATPDDTKMDINIEITKKN
jgi:hypothetical protein